MKKEIEVPIVQDGLWQDTNVVYSQVPGWLGHVTENLKLSVIYHFKNNSKKYPVIFWFSGGGWMLDDNNVHLPDLVDLAKAGYVIVSVQYRNSNEGIWPAQLQDAKSSIRYIKAHADKYQIDPDKIIVMGESAGGHLASMVGVTNNLRKYDVGSFLDYNSNVNVAIPWYGVVNLLSAKENSKTDDFDFVYRNILGADPKTNPELVKKADPINFINKNTVPFLIFHGTKDEVVPISDSEKLYDSLHENGVPVDLYEIKNAVHMDEAFMQPEISKIIVNYLNNLFNKNQ